MSAAFMRKTFAAGELIFAQGEPGDSLYVVEAGSVRIWSGDPDKPTIIGYVEPGGVFGEMAIFDKQPRMASASALTEATVMRMPASVLRQSLYGADPLLQQLVQILINNIRGMARRLADMERKLAAQQPAPPRE
ncbi:MAG TPA: cyclic nucleotide-binding domain-containing protein [Azospirillaceae bacterium]|nr:cyclic nucleotide-binding domain-containing protein [Azospirillaceae bacterium]